IYALGCMLYHLLTGAPPFKGETLVELIEAKEKGKFSPARRANEEVPDRLHLILDKLLAAKPDQRYQSCTEALAGRGGRGLASDPLSFLEGEVASAEKAGARPAKPAPKRAATAAPKPAPTAPHKEAADVWYASFKNAQGKQVTKKMSEAE